MFVVIETGSDRSGYFYSVLSYEEWANNVHDCIVCGWYKTKESAARAASQMFLDANQGE